MGLSPAEFEDLKTMTQIFDVSSRSAVAPSKFAEMQASTNTQLASAPALLQRPFVAMWKAIGQMIRGQSVHDSTDVARINDAMHSLRIADIHNYEAVGSIIILCRCLVSYEQLYTGRSAHVIYRYVLERLRPWKDFLQTNDGLFLVWMDTVECLVRRRIPVFKCSFDDTEYVDGFTGVARTILPLLYEICCLGATFKEKATLQQASINRIERDIRAWEPICPPKGLAEAEMISICTHATMYKTAALLILQQYQFPERTVSEEVRNMLKHAEYCIQKIGYTPPYTMAPLFIAGLQLDDASDRKRLLECMTSIPGAAISTPYEKMIGFLKNLWDIQKASSTVTWYDFLDHMPPFNIPP